MQLQMEIAELIRDPILYVFLNFSVHNTSPNMRSPIVYGLCDRKCLPLSASKVIVTFKSWVTLTNTYFIRLFQGEKYDHTCEWL